MKRGVFLFVVASSLLDHQPRVERGATLLGEARVTHAGASIGAVTIGLVAIGRNRAMRAVGLHGEPAIVEAEVRVERAPGVVEWWRSLPSGLEHGIDVADRPSGEGDLVLALSTGAAVPTAEPTAEDDDSIALRDARGRLLGRYAHLSVLDAAGAPVPARLAVAGGRIRIEIDDEGARYPLIVDPLLSVSEEAYLVAATPASNDRFGQAVALSADGTRAVVGASGDDTTAADAGSARVFLRSGSTWTEEASLVPPDAGAGDELGWSVGITADGSRVIVGARFDNVGGSDDGSARVFVRSGTTWTHEWTMSASGGASSDYFGSAVAIAADGTRAVVGAYRDDTPGGVDAGSARVYRRSAGGVWNEEATLLAPAGAANDEFGGSVAMTDDGSRVLVGAPVDDAAGGINSGSAHVFVRSLTTWSAEATLAPSSTSPSAYFGDSVSLSSDGMRALVGAHGDDTSVADSGSARVFVRSGSTWTQEAILSASDGVGGDDLGFSAAMSGDGARAVVGMRRDGGSIGSARLFLRTGTAWVEVVTLTVAPVGSGDYFGEAVGMSADGDRAIVGSDFIDVPTTNAGGAWIFRLAPAVANGGACTVDSQCTSDFCTDGVCCDGRCGSGATDCEACSAALTGGASGTCAALTPAGAAGVVCRAGAGPCDVPETCSSTSRGCPANAFAVPGLVCGSRDGRACDADDVCTGAGAACPPDAPSPSGTVCRPATGGCDPQEVCDGVGFVCPGDGFASAGVVCRSPAGACDVDERCTGASGTCPGDTYHLAGVLCRVAAGPCDTDETCSGLAAPCPADTFRPATTVCDPAMADVCDAPDHCTGSTANCPREFSSGAECRATAGACDLSETCSGTSASCPPDALVSAGVLCRAAGAACDVAEACDGTSTGCPADVVACTDTAGLDAAAGDGGALPDAPGTDAATPPPPDGGTSPAAAAGCACGAVRTPAPLGPLLPPLALWAMSLARRRPRAVTG